MQNEDVVNEIAREIFVRVMSDKAAKGAMSAGSASGIAENAYACAEAFAQVARKNTQK